MTKSTYICQIIVYMLKFLGHLIILQVKNITCESEDDRIEADQNKSKQNIQEKINAARSVAKRKMVGRYIS